MKKKKTIAKKKVPIKSEKPDKKKVLPSPKPLFPIVGIGASAGGLAAFETFFSGMPVDADPGMAFVLVQHLAPDHKSILAELIQRYTRMQVYEVKDGMVVKPNCAYIIPPGHDMAFLKGALRLYKPSSARGQRLSIDFFFRSLARDQGEKAIGIVLAGTGSDGTIGMREIKGEGGMIMVQTPGSTEYDSMPRSAIATGLADYELPPEEMAAALIAYSSHAFKKKKSAKSISAPKIEDSLKKIFILVRTHTGHDFSSYKSNTIRRRIERRMAVHQIDSIKKYLKYLQQSKDEIDALFKDMLIGVTNFFRDIDSFNSLKETVIPKLFANKSEGSVVRVWSAGCSTGEEAYSIAILLQEHMESLKKNFNIQVFATDIDPHAIAYARTGIYPESITADIAPEHLKRFFTSDSDKPDSEVHTYRIKKRIRDMIIFSEQNIIKDASFSKLDLICCRNLMIYLSSDLQKKLIPLFHYALNPNGFLFLGTSESVGEFTDMFQLIDRKSKLYLRNDNVLSKGRKTGKNLFPHKQHTEAESPEPIAVKPVKDKVTARELAEQTLLKYLAPSSALVNAKGDIIYLHGRTGKYLEPTEGDVGGYNIINMAREGLRNKLATSFRNAVKNKEIVNCPNLSVKTNGGFTTVNLSICPAVVNAKNSTSDQMFLIVLQEGKTSLIGQNGKPAPHSDDTSGSIKENSDKSHESLIASLRGELRAKEDYLQTTIEELETSNEELNSTNEEMQSVNEEMQSTNEELETSKEELQSVNEELSTVNNELSVKILDLSRANNDMNNLLSGTGIATVFMNHQLEILSFTPTASELINLIKSDIGRPVNHILTNLSGYDNLQEDIKSVLKTLTPKTIEVETLKGDWYKMSILPYRTLDNVIEGAVITFVDVTKARNLQKKLQKQLYEKMILFKEINHRVKNNIGNIEGLLTLQAHSTNNPEVKTALKDSISRVKSIRALYDRLLMGKDNQEVSIKEYAENLIDSLTEVFSEVKNVSVEKKISNFTIDSNKAISVGMIINECMTNVYKYAFKDRDSGSVLISIKKTKKKLTLTVHDNGIGIDEKLNVTKSPGFGLTIVKMLVDQLNGTLSIKNKNGTKSVIQFEL